MATPRWVRQHRTTEHLTTKLIRSDQRDQAIDRVTVEHHNAEQWTPRPGMSFATEGDRP
jgi:hypothetical protein